MIRGILRDELALSDVAALVALLAIVVCVVVIGATL